MEKTYTITELKAMAYDILAQREQLDANLQRVNQMIVEQSKEEQEKEVKEKEVKEEKKK